MSADDLLTADDLRTLKEPAKRWRNRWRVTSYWLAEFRPETEFTVQQVYPSKEIAETRAERDLIALFARHGVQFVASEIPQWFEHIGAFPVDDAP